LSRRKNNKIVAIDTKEVHSIETGELSFKSKIYKPDD